MTTAVRTINPISQLVSLSHAEFVLLTRNVVQLFYAVVMPLMIPFLFANVTDSEGLDGLLASVITLSILFALLLVSYYNPLSALVNRREESTLQRLRAGELSDGLILLSVCMPGLIIGVIIPAITLFLAMKILNLPTPEHVWLIILATVLMLALLPLLAILTANFTRTAESAQMTSMPLITIMSVGSFAQMVPDSAPTVLRVIVQAIPSGPFSDLMTMGWFGGVETSTVLRATGIMLAWIIVCAGYAKLRFRWAPRV